jgi:hypothetical protein
MDIDVRIGKVALTINIENPHRIDTAQVMQRIADLGKRCGVDMADLHIDKLIQRMVRGVSGCENGCPADAKSLVREGFQGFDISYIEGGILSADKTLMNGKSLGIKVFPDFM